jgi:RNA polymerase-binding transcription factor DksA
MSKKTDKKASVKKAAKPKAANKKTAAKKVARPKKAVKKTVVKKVTAKKTVKKPKAVKKTVVKKAAAKKAAPKKSAAKKVTSKRVADKKTTVKPKTTIKQKPTTKVKSKVSTKKTAKVKSATKSKAKAVTQEVEVLSPSKKVKKIKGYSKTELDQFKQVILDKREEIIEQLQNLKDQMMDPTTGQYVNESSPYSLHMAEQGTDAQEREKLYLWAQRENKFLGYLEDALQRIENGTYGICIDCIDEPKNLCPTCPLVPKDRLMAVPHTQHCLQVKQTMRKS